MLDVHEMQGWIAVLVLVVETKDSIKLHISEFFLFVSYATMGRTLAKYNLIVH